MVTCPITYTAHFQSHNLIWLWGKIQILTNYGRLWIKVIFLPFLDLPLIFGYLSSLFSFFFSFSHNFDIIRNILSVFYQKYFICFLKNSNHKFRYTKFQKMTKKKKNFKTTLNMKNTTYKEHETHIKESVTHIFFLFFPSNVHTALLFIN